MKKIRFDLNSGNKGFKDRMKLVLDSLLNQYLEDRDVIFGGENIRKSIYFSKLASERKDWEKSKDCYFPGCKRMSIRFSHTISEGCLKFLADVKGNLITPQVNHKIGEIEFVPVHSGTASTFAGFCNEHENIFRDFEGRKELISQNDFMLQAFRSLCREIRKANSTFSNMQTSLEAYELAFADWSKKYLLIELEKYFYGYENVDFKSIGFSVVDDLLKDMREHLKELKDYIEILEVEYFPAFNNQIDTGVLILPIFEYRHPEKLPVAISGRGNIRLEINGKVENVVFLVNVVPSQNGSNVFIFGLHKHKNHLEQYVSQHLSIGPLGLAIMIEAWMLNGTDHWFMNPQFFSQLDPIKLKLMKEHILSTKRDCLNYPDVSIFDIMKKNSFDNFETELENQRSLIPEDHYQILKNILLREKAKVLKF